MNILDCTLRDGGYYNNWDFSLPLVNDYLAAMEAAGVNIVELGLRSTKNVSFKGACAFSSDSFLRELNLPENLKCAVMLNASELVSSTPYQNVLESLFPDVASNSPVDIVRIACHVHEFKEALPAVKWLKNKGYIVGFNLMQIATCSKEDVVKIASEASQHSLDVLYFADSMGGMGPEDVSKIISWLREGWKLELGIHTHDNKGLALQNTLRAIADGVTWVDATVTGMGRGPGNARTEELVLELESYQKKPRDLIPLMRLVRKHFKPMQQKYGWGTNPYYYLSGKYGIHPTYIQKMLSDSRYDEEDIIAVINHLQVIGGKSFSEDTLEAARHFYNGVPSGTWSPTSLFKDQEILLLGTGPGVAAHRSAIESYIQKHKPVVMALNTQTSIDAEMIDVRVACHPVRLLADCGEHALLPQPLITPASMLPVNIREALKSKELFDFGLGVESNKFEFCKNHCILPTSLVIAYAMAIASSGKASRILLAGFDGYGADDQRNQEMNKLIRCYQEQSGAIPLCAITPSRYELDSKSVYGFKS